MVKHFRDDYYEIHPTKRVPPMGSGNLEYTVSGTGVQTVNIHYYYNEWLNYTVSIDGQSRAENDGWKATKDGWLTISGAKAQVTITYGEIGRAHV